MLEEIKVFKVLEEGDLDRFITLPENGVYLKSKNESSVELWMGYKILAIFFADKPAEIFIDADGQNLQGSSGPEGSRMKTIYLGNPTNKRLKQNGERLLEGEYSLTLESQITKVRIQAHTRDSSVLNCTLTNYHNRYSLSFATGEGWLRRELGLPMDRGSFGWWKKGDRDMALTLNPFPELV